MERRSKMSDFKPKKIWDAIYPEAFGVLLYLGTKMGARYIKEAKALTGWKNPEYYVDGAALAVPAALIGMGKAEQESKAVLYAAAGVVGEKLAQKAYDSTIGKGAKKIGRGKIRGNPGGGVLSEAERAKQIAQARANALTIRQPATVGSYTEF